MTNLKAAFRKRIMDLPDYFIEMFNGMMVRKWCLIFYELILHFSFLTRVFVKTWARIYKTKKQKYPLLSLVNFLWFADLQQDSAFS